ncbi:MAG: hypothetical protein LUG47_01550 [Clostridiales bacterium]|nr:hypothetical protein [Clostridiales bacterium]
MPVLYSNTLVGIDHGAVSSGIHRITEGQTDIGPLGLGQAGRRQTTSGGRIILIIQNDREGNGITFTHLEGKVGLCFGLRGGDRLRVDVHAHFQPGSESTLDVRLKHGVLIKRPVAGPAIAATNHHKADAGRLDLCPVDRAVPLGDVNALGDGISVELTAVGIGGNGRDAVVLIFLNRPVLQQLEEFRVVIVRLKAAVEGDILICGV